MNNKSALSIAVTAGIILSICSISHAGTIFGTVKYKGKVPKFREIKMDADPICLSKHAGKVFPDTLKLGIDNGMANVFIRIKDGIFDAPFKAPKNAVVLSQEGCMYSPRIVGIMVGQPLKILNPDGTLHNVHALSKINDEFNLAMPKFRREAQKSFSKPEFMFPIKCDVHPWMSAWISVLDHPFFRVTNKNGEFSITGVPEGSYVVEAWHEKLGTQINRINVIGGGDYKSHFTFTR